MDIRYLINLIKEAEEPPEFHNLVGDPQIKTKSANMDLRKLKRKRASFLDKHAKNPSIGMQAHGRPANNEQEYILKSYIPTNPHEDAKYQYAKMIVELGLNNKNRYVPLIYKISSVKDPKSGLEKFQYKMQKYHLYSEVPVSGILECFEDILYSCGIETTTSEFLLAVGRNIIESEYNDDISVINHIKSISNPNSEELRYYENHNLFKESVVQYMCHIFEQIIDNDIHIINNPDLEEILGVIKELDSESIGNIDFHEHNVMFKHANGWQIIFTDPLYGNY